MYLIRLKNWSKLKGVHYAVLNINVDEYKIF